MTTTLSASPTPVPVTESIAEIATRIGREIAAPASGDVDVQGRFPAESLAAYREAGLLSALIPVELGGRGATLRELSDAVRIIAQHCASSALVLAMHSATLYMVIRHGTSEPLRELLREVAERQLLIGNAVSEVGIGGGTGRSLCSLVPVGDDFTIDKQALAVSYGLYADLILTEARRHPDAAETDQVMVICRAEDLQLDPISDWNTLGLRGTRSAGLRVQGHVRSALIFPEPAPTVMSHSGAHSNGLMLASVSVGLAEAAASAAHTAVRSAARKSVGTVPPSATRLAELVVILQQSRGALTAALAHYEEVLASGDLEDISFLIELRNLKNIVSVNAVHCATAALQICGISAYKRDSPTIVERLVRDTHGSLVMVSNDRNLIDNAQLYIARKTI